MKTKKDIIIVAVSNLIAMALSTGGYFLGCYVISLLLMVSPILWIIVHGLFCVGYIAAQAFGAWSPVGDWIESKIRSVHMWWKCRKAQDAEYVVVN